MIRLIYNYYEDKNLQRKKEIDLCLQKNLANSALNVVIYENASKPTYKDLFEKANSLTGPNDINIVCNSDIFFDSTIELTEKYLLGKTAYALCRWEWADETHNHFWNRSDSQDTWIVRGKFDNVYGDFQLGIRGCDNRIAHEFQKAGYTVRNPSRTIKTFHVHNSGVRTYRHIPPIPPPYLTLPPTDIV